MVVHWGVRAWHKNLDEMVFDPEYPQAFPARRPTDLMGRIRVRLRAEDHSLVAYGFGGQRFVFPVSEIGSVRTAGSYRTGRRTRSQALLIFDKEQRILLRAPGLWETYGEVTRVCKAAGAPLPSHVTGLAFTGSRTRYGNRGAGRARQRQAVRAKQKLPLYRKAPGYRRLRVTARGTTLRVLAAIALLLAAIAAAVTVGLLPALFLPGWVGKVRVMIGIAGAGLGLAAGIWVFGAITQWVADGLRWAVASFQAAGIAPLGRFFRRRESSGYWSAVLTSGLMVLVPLLVIFGPGTAIVSGIHGVSDSRLVAGLRANGVRTRGSLIDVPEYSTDSNGNTTVTDVATLSFRAEGQNYQVTDPSIGGRPLPLNAADPAGTDVPLTVVYDSDDPGTAAAEQQMTGSVWHGAPTANVIVGILFTLLLPPVIWAAVVRLRRRKWLRNADLLDDLATAAD